ncbi:MAG: preprotein translocase subunit SecE [Candidatus Vogelbacteria bacterium]|nr:preprotein translocase subunit SecE [Candidatus Vogelbacteria bacterium]
MQTLIDYIRGTRAELAHVSWPTTRQSVAYTAIVIGVSLGVAFYLTFFDTIFLFVLNNFVF